MTYGRAIGLWRRQWFGVACRTNYTRCRLHQLSASKQLRHTGTVALTVCQSWGWAVHALADTVGTSPPLAYRAVGAGIASPSSRQRSRSRSVWESTRPAWVKASRHVDH
jgi:hypothetical protein